jgi:hypothetical protein
VEELKNLLTLNTESENPAHELYGKLRHAKNMVGAGIFGMGAILSTMKKYELWTGYAQSWREFCAAEAHSYSHAQNCIRLYDKYVGELKLSEDVIEQLICRDYTCLGEVCKVITVDDAEEWVHKLLTLGRQDIIKEVRSAQGKEEINKSEVDKIVLLYFSLATWEERAEVKRIIEERESND